MVGSVLTLARQLAVSRQLSDAMTQAFNALGTTIGPKIGGLLILSAAPLAIEQLQQLTPKALQLYRVQEAATVKMPYAVIGLCEMLIVLTILALSFGGLVSGALVTETMFAYPGMGKLIFDAVMGNDYNLALAALLLATAVTMVANLAADLAYAWLDPRVSYR